MIFKKSKGNQNKIKLRGRKRKLFASTMLILRLFFGGPQSASASSNSKNVQDGVGSKAAISRTFSRDSSMIADLNQDDCPQSESVPEGTQRTIISPSGKIISIIPRGGDNNQPGNPSKFGPGSKAKGAAKSKRDFARRQAGKTPTSRQSGGGFFADAFTVEPKFPARPGRLELFGRVPSEEQIQPKPGRGLRVRSIATTDENGEIKTIYYDKDGPDESKFLDDVDLARDDSPNPTDQHIQSETKSQAEDAHNQNSGLTKARNNLTPVKDDKLTSEGDSINPSELTSKGRSVIDKTKDRRAAPLLQSRYEDRDKEFLPAYGIQQVANKDKHTLEVLEKLGKNITKYNELPESKQLQIDLTIVEGLLAHRDTELHMNVMGQGREPIALVLNRGLGDYLLQNHIGTFERRPEISEYNPYISNYLAKDSQIKGFDLSNSTSITYEDLMGNSHTNIGPVFGKTDSPTSAPTVNDVNPEL